MSVRDPSGKYVSYNRAEGTLRNRIPHAYVNVSFNVDVVVVPILPGSGGRFHLTVSQVPSTARGGVVFLGREASQGLHLTEALRSGVRRFSFELFVPGLPVSPPPLLLPPRLADSTTVAILLAVAAGGRGGTLPATPTLTVSTTANGSAFMSFVTSLSDAFGRGRPLFLDRLVGLNHRLVVEAIDQVFRESLQGLASSSFDLRQSVAAPLRTVLKPFGDVGLQMPTVYWQGFVNGLRESGLSIMRVVGNHLSVQLRGENSRLAPPQLGGVETPRPTPIEGREELSPMDEGDADVLLPMAAEDELMDDNRSDRPFWNPTPHEADALADVSTAFLLVAGVCQARWTDRHATSQAARQKPLGLHATDS
jgi:hypothetical protein